FCVGRSMSKDIPNGQFSILYFAAAATFTHKSSEKLPAPMSVADLYKHLGNVYPGIEDVVLTSCLLTINLEYVDIEEDTSKEASPRMIKEGDEVAIIPPVSSG
ncbi:MAG: hypothetical protein Q9222_004630, partial [Ikaeria aurantiellina]